MSRAGLQAGSYPLVEQYSVNVQHELPYGISLEVGYVGEHSKYLPQSVGINQLPNGLACGLSHGYAAASSVNTTAVPNPYYAPTVTNGTTTYRTTGTVAGTTIAPGQLLLPYPQFAGGASSGTGVTLIESVGYSLYNALTVKVQKRYPRADGRFRPTPGRPTGITSTVPQARSALR